MSADLVTTATPTTPATFSADLYGQRAPVSRFYVHTAAGEVHIHIQRTLQTPRRTPAAHWAQEQELDFGVVFTPWQSPVFHSWGSLGPCLSLAVEYHKGLCLDPSCSVSKETRYSS